MLKRPPASTRFDLRASNRILYDIIFGHRRSVGRQSCEHRARARVFTGPRHKQMMPHPLHHGDHRTHYCLLSASFLITARHRPRAFYLFTKTDTDAERQTHTHTVTDSLYQAVFACIARAVKYQWQYDTI